MNKICAAAILATSLAVSNVFAEKQNCMDAFSNNDVNQALVLKFATGNYHIGKRKPKMNDIMEWSATCGWISELISNPETAKEWGANYEIAEEVNDYISGLVYYVLTGKLINKDDIVLCRINQQLQEDVAFQKIPAASWPQLGVAGQPKYIPLGRKTCQKYDTSALDFE